MIKIDYHNAKVKFRCAKNIQRTEWNPLAVALKEEVAST